MNEEMQTFRNLAYVREHVDYCTCLEQLAEEASELAHAALKLNRVIKGASPSPVTRGEAFANLVEEVTDVKLCVDSLWPLAYDPDVYGRKLARWRSRLEQFADISTTVVEAETTR